MKEKLIRVGTTYLPVQDIEKAAKWYERVLDAKLNYIDEDKAIVNLANQSFFLVKAPKNETANFIDINGKERFSLTFEVNGIEELVALHNELSVKGVTIGDIENRGHAGRNFVFSDADGNKFDVWSELSPSFKE
ncbi:catechol 2,3-dioxygenase-like lactoylglutathione lyase family enzyme [Salirhabdus euzebyi]|uniref:Catechol 2,3-dioxygenase-like lactoylglutathione lyase family enzyme n=1 Tax=Salirhabdus euzebyi TaxID=394506 RepID=A0A841QA98_9BACI|nr:VOC family protein [Salirhabdus euzebyi]MBB6455340.1 catechol 2,3-dioxygenase-like lactoylglutathione lyase family enzyme [Salirhabdus euzebyi]